MFVPSLKNDDTCPFSQFSQTRVFVLSSGTFHLARVAAYLQLELRVARRGAHSHGAVLRTQHQAPVRAPRAARDALGVLAQHTCHLARARVVQKHVAFRGGERKRAAVGVPRAVRELVLLRVVQLERFFLPRAIHHRRVRGERTFLLAVLPMQHAQLLASGVPRQVRRGGDIAPVNQ